MNALKTGLFSGYKNMQDKNYIKAERLTLNYPLLDASSKTLRGMMSKDRHRFSLVRDKAHEVHGISNLSFEIFRGDRVGLIGPNGAGKTTLLKVLAGIYTPSSGSLKIKGEVSSMIDMGLGFDEDATGVENIFLNGYLSGCSKSEISERLEYIIEFADIGAFINFPLRVYSAGMRTRLAFAIASSRKPDIFLIDEVFGAGDADFLQKSRKKMDELIDRSNILFFASHTNELIRDYCNKAMIMRGGELLFFGATEEALEYYKQLERE